MRSKYLIKAIPFITSFLLITLLTISNQKENTKLRILVWNTPSFSLGTYLAISAGTGFILSYYITTYLSKSYQIKASNSFKYSEKREYAERYEDSNKETNVSYDNTLIERDMKDPPPTINASFRVIGRTERANTNFINNNNNTYDDSMELEDQYDVQSDNKQTINQSMHSSTDWNDESYSSW